MALQDSQRAQRDAYVNEIIVFACQQLADTTKFHGMTPREALIVAFNEANSTFVRSLLATNEPADKAHGAGHLLNAAAATDHAIMAAMDGSRKPSEPEASRLAITVSNALATAGRIAVTEVETYVNSLRERFMNMLWEQVARMLISVFNGKSPNDAYALALPALGK